MGSNRSGKRRTQRMKRAKRHLARLAQKEAAQTPASSTEQAPRPAGEPGTAQ
jgi:hypothetical protein